MRIAVVICLTPLLAWAGGFSLCLENDVFNSTDKYYTHGTRAVFSESSSNGYAVGQLIYTPLAKFEVDKQVEDRPYAGWLYLGKLWVTGRPSKYGVYEVDVGVIGPEAGGESTQTAFHELIGVAPANGWSNQIPTRPAINASYRQVWEREWGYRLGTRVKPYGLCALGNVLTELGAGIEAHVGYYPPRGFQPAGIALRGLYPRWSATVFAGVEGRVVFYNAFLEEDGYTINKEPFVGDVRVGVQGGYRGLSAAIAQVYRSLEFEEQDGCHAVTSLTVSYRF